MEYKNVSSREWADQIRAIKLHELQEIIERKEIIVPQLIIGFIAVNNNSISITAQSSVLKMKEKITGDILRLKNKFEILIKKS